MSLLWCYWRRFCVPAGMSRLYCTLFCFHILASRTFLSSLVGVDSWWSMMVIRFPRSSSKSFDCLFIKSLFCWYCFWLLWYLEGLLLRAHRRCLSVSSKVDLVCSSKIWYFIFIDFVFLLIFGEGLGSFICDILLISARSSFIRRFILIQSPFLLLMFLFLMMQSFSTHPVLIVVIAAA